MKLLFFRCYNIRDNRYRCEDINNCVCLYCRILYFVRGIVFRRLYRRSIVFLYIFWIGRFNMGFVVL